ncbi:hypothetical protein GCM10025768_19470 [Microbacterium pseudoresistens]|uniref:CMD domain protein n=1 Tax=Microbacterium pseudoresistens TaxID=640634 RepID=A0A7Y9JP03_9MICO|nr:CMD domain protein [Microbacterium pseudoresistens]NYD55641.1 CMD domain protein [Microbacterium pseudoresistens]
MTVATADIVDLLAGVAPQSRIHGLRALRAQARENAQRSFEALLEPRDPGAFSLGERYAVAAFVARVHGQERAAEFYADLLGDEEPELVPSILAAAADGASAGPYGAYREPGLSAESAPGTIWQADVALGARLAAALTHAHLLVFRPRESDAAALRALATAGWDADEIVSLSQLVAFLSFQLRLVHGLRVLSDDLAADAQGPAAGASVIGEGDVR